MVRHRKLPRVVNRKHWTRTDEPIGREALKLVKRVKRTKQSNEYADYATYAAVAIATSWTIVGFSMAEGDDIGNRDSRQVYVRRLQLLGGVSMAVASTTPQRIRLVIIRDTMNNGATPAATDVFNTNVVDAFYNKSSSSPERFKVLYDRIFSLGIINGDVAAKWIRFSKKLNYLQEYLGTTAAVANNGKNAMFAMVCCDNSTGGASVINLNARVWYDR